MNNVIHNEFKRNYFPIRSSPHVPSQCGPRTCSGGRFFPLPDISPDPPSHSTSMNLNWVVISAFCSIEDSPCMCWCEIPLPSWWDSALMHYFPQLSFAIFLMSPPHHGYPTYSSRLPFSFELGELGFMGSIWLFVYTIGLLQGLRDSSRNREVSVGWVR